MYRCVDWRRQLQRVNKWHALLFFYSFWCVNLLSYSYRQRRVVKLNRWYLDAVAWIGRFLLGTYIVIFLINDWFTLGPGTSCEREADVVRFTANLLYRLYTVILAYAPYLLSQQLLATKLNDCFGNWRNVSELTLHKCFERVPSGWILHVLLRAIRCIGYIAFAVAMVDINFNKSALTYPNIVYEATLQLVVFYMHNVVETFVCLNVFIGKKLQSRPPNHQCLRHATASARKLYAIGMETLRQYRDSSGKMSIFWLIAFLKCNAAALKFARLLVVHYPRQCWPIPALHCCSIIAVLLDVVVFRQLHARLEAEVHKFIFQLRIATKLLLSCYSRPRCLRRSEYATLAVLINTHRQIILAEVLIKSRSAKLDVDFQTFQRFLAFYVACFFVMKPLDYSTECSIYARFDYITQEFGRNCTQIRANASVSNHNDTRLG